MWEYFSTGYYLPPGEEMKIDILNDEDDDTFRKYKVGTMSVILHLAHV